MCQNVQTTVGGGGVRAKSERPNFLRPYLPNGGGGSGVLDNVQNLVGFFLMAPLITSDSQSKIDHLIVRLNLNSFTTTLFQGGFKYYGISQGGSMINTFVKYWE